MQHPLPSPVGEELLFAHVSCRYGRHAVVRDACLRVHPGEHVALIGANGSGKTTLLRAALGLQPGTTGTIAVGGRAGRSRADLASRRREMAWMPQRQATGRFPLLVGELLESSTAAESAARAAVRLGLAGLTARPLETLSGGQLQRAFLARAIGDVHGGSTVLLADEPTAALDFAAKAEVIVLLADLPVTELVVTHDPAVAAACDRRLEMAAGHLRDVP